MRKPIFAAMALALMAGTAVAADLPHYKAPLPPPPPPPPLWTGFYVGLNAGYTWSNSSNISTVAFPVFNASGLGGAVPGSFASAFAATSLIPARSDGFIGGGQIGYNWQFYNSFVAGVEADIQGIAASSNRGATSGAFPVSGFAPITAVSFNQASASLDYLGTVRGRLGWLFTPTLLAYGTGGLAYGGVQTNTNIVQAFANQTAVPGFFGATSFSDTRVGWTAGGGLEWMFWPSWSAKVEYLYYDLGSVTQNFTLPSVNNAGTLFFFNAGQARTRFNGNIVRAGLNYHFNWGAPPVVAKY
ncbi:outer membrane beta-barrel protein [Methylocystis sp. 9N]|uniref:Outer membrane beta-barrel protein n=1 Tax=Methylocystis borbori TaxID=3118750 RepID=A0ABU7XFS1_9HYPH